MPRPSTEDLGGSGAVTQPSAWHHAGEFETRGIAGEIHLFGTVGSTSGVTDMEYMFDHAEAFNRDIGAWDTSGITEERWNTCSTLLDRR